MSAPREQEQSIKDRKKLLFDDEPAPASTSSEPRKSFAAYLHDTPAQPLSPGVKAALWGVGVVVGLLLAAAAWKVSQGKPRPAPKPRAQILAPAAPRPA